MLKGCGILRLRRYEMTRAVRCVALRALPLIKFSI